MRARDQSSIFSTGGKFHPDYGLLLELHALTLVARSYVLLTVETPLNLVHKISNTSLNVANFTGSFFYWYQDTV